MTVAHLAQPGILAPIPSHARYLSLQLRVGADPTTALRRLATQADGDETVVAIGPSLVRVLGKEIPGLREFRGIDGARVKLPSTPVDLLLWLRGSERGELLLRSRHLETLLAPSFEVVYITDAIRHGDGRDLTGYKNQAERLVGESAAEAAMLPSTAGVLAGSCFATAMRWHHRLSRFEAMSRSQQDHTFGRERDTGEAIPDAPPSAHANRVNHRSFSPPAVLLRRSMPYVDGNEGGFAFACFAPSFDPFERLLTRMTGAEDGIVDALFSFSEPRTTAYLWCPPVKEGWMDFSALGI
ncbi:Dyp-type peroxidase [Hydrogenophaga sp. 5NK40-0174]|uniref:Dyp-type peroxidase n=1 Tax=Hydrogenophaga sp. 5NK40-0174 TaxID=3127649 RepID=UPI00310C783A